MNVICWLAILAWCASCISADQLHEECQDSCEDVCVPCQSTPNCTEYQTDCGLGKPNPAFGGICPTQKICVPKTQNCMSILICLGFPFSDHYKTQP